MNNLLLNLFVILNRYSYKILILEEQEKESVWIVNEFIPAERDVLYNQFSGVNITEFVKTLKDVSTLNDERMLIQKTDDYLNNPKTSIQKVKFSQNWRWKWYV